MRTVSNSTAVIADEQVGMVVLLMCYLSDHVYEGHGLVIIFEGEFVIDRWYINI